MQDSKCNTCGSAISTKFGRKYCSNRCLVIERVRKDNEIASDFKTGTWKDFANRREIARHRRTGCIPLRFQVKKCSTCLGPFTPKNKHQEACSSECRKDLVREYQRRWSIDSRSKNPSRRISQLVSSNISKLLSSLRTRKCSNSAKLLGMNGSDFMDYLVNHTSNKDGLFTCENYGKVWHVDHIRPLASFDLTDYEQQKIAFHYTNCQPLSVEDNLKKSSRWNGKRHRYSK